MIKSRRLLQSFKHSMRGVSVVFKNEQSFRIQVIAAITVLLLACLLKLTAFEFIVIMLLIGSVLVLELINSIFERIVDTFKPRIHPAVRDIKDIMAGTVLIASFIAAFIGIVIFLPKIILLFS